MNFIKDSSTNTFKKYELGDYPSFTIFNDETLNGYWIEFSVNGDSIDGIVFQNEGIEFRDAFVDRIYIRSYNPNTPCNFRIWSYGKSVSQQFTNQEIRNKGLSLPLDLNTNVEGERIPAKPETIFK